MASSEPQVVPLEPIHAQALAEMFERAGHHCYCRYLHFPGDKYAWQDRLANSPEQSRSELIAAVRSQSPEARGVVAIAPEAQHVVGWLKLSPAQTLDKLYGQRLYRRLPCFERSPEGVFTLGCFFIDPEYRRQGIARMLVHAAIELGRQLGACSLEALPRGTPDASDAEYWLGRTSTFLAAGFQTVHDFAPYPVLRLNLRKPQGLASA